MWIAIGFLWIVFGFLGDCMYRHWWVNRFGDCEGIPRRWMILLGLCNLMAVAFSVLTNEDTVLFSNRKFNKWGFKLKGE